MDLEIIEEKIGAVTISQKLSPFARYYVVPETAPFLLLGKNVESLFQAFSEETFSVWFNHYKVDNATVLRASGQMQVLELRISLSKPIEGTWDKVEDPLLPPHFFNIYYTPFVATRAILSPGIFESIDIHVSAEMLQALGLESAQLDGFISRVMAKRPAQLYTHPQPCTQAMIDAAFALKHLKYQKKMQNRMMETKAREVILLSLAPLEQKNAKAYISYTFREQLFAARKLIEENLDEYPKNEVICRYTGLNETKLIRGFQKLFSMKPYEFYIQLKMNYARKRLLESDELVKGIAFELGYEQESNFIREFRKYNNCTPAQFRLNRG